MSALALGTRWRFSRPCSMSRSCSSSPGLDGSAVASDVPPVLPLPLSAKRASRSTPATRATVSTPSLRFWGTAMTREVT